MLENTRADMTAVPARRNGKRARKRVDGRFAAARRAKQLVSQYVAALGGPEAIDAVMRARIVRTAELTVIAENCRAAMLAGRGTVLLNDLVRVEHTSDLALKRLMEQRREQPSVPTLDEYLASKAKARS